MSNNKRYDGRIPILDFFADLGEKFAIFGKSEETSAPLYLESNTDNLFRTTGEHTTDASTVSMTINPRKEKDRLIQDAA